MLKVGDKVIVSVKINQIIEDESGTHYVVGLIKGNSYNSLKVTQDDIKSYVEK